MVRGAFPAGFRVRLWLPARAWPVVPAKASPSGPVPGGPGDRGPVAEGYAENGSAS